MEKADLIIRGDYVLPMEDNLEVIRDGAVAVSGKNIIGVDTFEVISKKYSASKILNGKNKVVLPGLINTHTHAPMVYFRGLADDLPLKDWLEKHIWPAEAKWLSDDFVSDAVELASMEMLKAGITTYCDMYFCEDASARKLEKIGMKAVLGAGIIDFPTKFASNADGYLKNAEEFISAWKGNDLITPGIAPHATYTCSPDTYKKAQKVAEKYGVLLHTHLAETMWEVSEIKKNYGKTPVEHLDSIGVLSDRFSAAHCVWLSDREIEILAKTRAGVCHCVESNLKLASGIAPVVRMLKAGVRLSFGTDGAASNNDLNILSEMSTAAKLHKAVSEDPTALDTKTALLMATRWGAEILGLGDNTGSLKPGKRADIVIAGIDKPHLVPIYNIYSHITYSMRPSDVETVMINGNIVVDNGKLTTMDEEGIISKARAWQDKIKKS